MSFVFATLKLRIIVFAKMKECLESVRLAVVEQVRLLDSLLMTSVSNSKTL